MDVHAHGHVAHFLRLDGREPSGSETALPPVHSKINVHAPVGVDLRHPWVEWMDIAATGGVQEFERKHTRNDYPVVALWETGARKARVPLQDLVDPAVPLTVEVHDGFDFWVDGVDDAAADVRASLDRAKSYAHPTVRLTGLDAAYWTQIGEKEHLRWVTPFAEEPLLDGLARLHAAGTSDLGENTRLVGMFRAHGLVCPVWDLPLGTGAAAIEEPAAAFAARLADAMADDAPLSSAERHARAGLSNRQVTLR